MFSQNPTKGIDSYNNNNAENQSPDCDVPHQGYMTKADFQAYLLSRGQQIALTTASNTMGPIQPQTLAKSPNLGRANWLSGMKVEYFAPAVTQDKLSYFSALSVPEVKGLSYLSARPEAGVTGEYAASFAEVTQAPLPLSAVEARESAISAEQSRLRALHDAAVKAHNDRINQILLENGFINRVDITRGITASVAVFEYIGDDTDIHAIAKFGFVLVKIPPYVAAPTAINVVDRSDVELHEAAGEYVRLVMPEKSYPQLHAESTYQNEFNIISQLNSPAITGGRLKLLSRVFGGEQIILNSPIFYDEAEFLRIYTNIQKGRHRNLFSSSDSVEGDSSEEVLGETAKISAIENLLQNSFTNLACRMRMLDCTKEDPIHIMRASFSSLMDEMNELHNRGIMHGDMATRNVVSIVDYSAVWVDYGVADRINKISGNAVANVKYLQTSMMHNIEALREDHLISVITDYISFQKTILQAIADFMHAEFYKLIVAGLPNAPKIPTIEFLLNFTDRQIMDNAKKNLKAVAESLAQRGERRGSLALKMIAIFEPFIDHDYNNKLTFIELQKANTDCFYRCVISAYTRQSRSQTLERVSAYYSRVEASDAAPAAAPASRPEIPRRNTAEKAGFFSNRSRSNSVPNPNRTNAPGRKQ